MLQRLVGRLFRDGSGHSFRGPVPGAPEITKALDRLEEHVVEIGRDQGTGEFDEPVTAAERERLGQLVAAMNRELQDAGSLEAGQTLALVGRLTEIIRKAGHCDRYPNPVKDIGNLPISALHDILSASASRHGVDCVLHDALMVLAAALTDALLEGADPWAERFVVLAKKYSEPEDDPADPARMLEAFILDASAHPHHSRMPKIQDLPAGRKILDAAPDVQRDVLLEAFKVLAEAIDDNAMALKKQGSTSEWYGRSSQRCNVAGEMAGRLLKRKLPSTGTMFATMIGLMLRPGIRWLYRWPLVPLVGAIERHVEKNGLEADLHDAVTGLLEIVRGRVWDHIDERLERLLGKSENKFLIPHSELGLAIVEWVNAQDDSLRQAWLELLQLGLQIGSKAKPASKWSEQAAEIVERIGEAGIVERLVSWIENPGIALDGPEPNGDIVKSMIWAVAKSSDEKLASVIGRLCEVSYKKVPGVGPANVKLGNACIYALGEMPGERAVAELVRLRSRIKFNNGRKKLQEALTAAADRSGMTVADLEESALPTFGLDAEGARRVALGDATAEIRIAGSDEVTLSWTGADGKPRKTVPASVKADHADALKALRAEIKEIKGLLSGQRFRLESLYLGQRSWSFAEWRKRYLEHPLLANLARRLIWDFNDAPAVPTADGFVGQDGAAVEPAADATVALWHPIEATADKVLAWRRRLAALEIIQPFKQAHREIYVLTDAERATETYSNRFAAHVIRQHQLNALCQARAWRFGQFLIWDLTGAVPARPLPGFGLQAEFWVDPIDYDQHTEATGAYLFLSTDQVRFVDDTSAAVPLSQVPPIIFSEIMRDVDLFVGVASVANNPEWQDGGPEGRHREYWWGRSFGDIGARGSIRHDVLAELLPKLKIADRCELTEKFLVVRGTRRTYKIHLGSGNILMAPNDQYLCIVQNVRGLAKGGEKVHLPFEGDGVLSIILSKAFLLAADDRITDGTILSQIGG